VFFDNFVGIVRVIVIGSFAYVALIILLRFSGNRAFSSSRWHSDRRWRQCNHLLQSPRPWSSDPFEATR